MTDLMNNGQDNILVQGCHQANNQPYDHPQRSHNCPVFITQLAANPDQNSVELLINVDSFLECRYTATIN